MRPGVVSWRINRGPCLCCAPIAVRTSDRPLHPDRQLRTDTFIVPGVRAETGLKTSPVSSQVPLPISVGDGAPIFTKAPTRIRACPAVAHVSPFRKSGRLGAPIATRLSRGDERAPAEDPRIQRARRDHRGRIVGPVDEREARLLEMRRELRQAVEHEEYELAAELRDRISALEDDRRAARATAFESEEGL